MHADPVGLGQVPHRCPYCFSGGDEGADASLVAAEVVWQRGGGSGASEVVDGLVACDDVQPGGEAAPSVPGVQLLGHDDEDVVADVLDDVAVDDEQADGCADRSVAVNHLQQLVQGVVVAVLCSPGDVVVRQSVITRGWLLHLADPRSTPAVRQVVHRPGSHHQQDAAHRGVPRARLLSRRYVHQPRRSHEDAGHVQPEPAALVSALLEHGSGPRLSIRTLG